MHQFICMLSETVRCKMYQAVPFYAHPAGSFADGRAVSCLAMITALRCRYLPAKTSFLPSHKEADDVLTSDREPGAGSEPSSANKRGGRNRVFTGGTAVPRPDT